MKKEFLKEHPGLKGKIRNGYLKNYIKIDFEAIHETQIDKEKVREVIDKLISKSNNIYSFADEKKIKEVEFFGNDEREIREKGYMRWAFEDGGSESLIQLKKELGLGDQH